MRVRFCGHQMCLNLVPPSNQILGIRQVDLPMGHRAPQREEADDTHLDPTALRVVVLFRVLSLVWMGILVGLTLTGDPEANRVITIGALGIAIAWTGLTAYLSRRPNVLASFQFLLVDLIVILALGASSTLAGAKDFFHGGMPMSFVVIAAFAGGIRWAVIGSLVVAAEQVIVHAIDGRGDVGAAGSVVFIVFALTAGWAFDSFRIRGEVERQLADTIAIQARRDERLALADQLHDSALQTFIAIRAAADDPVQVRYLSRRQARELRSTIETFRSPHDDSFRVALLSLRDEIEDLHRVVVEAVVRGDSRCDAVADTVLKATHELLTNAAKHSGVSSIDLYADLGDDIEVIVRDRGAGFDTDATARSDGLRHTVYEPIAAIGGEATVHSTAGQGTKATIRVVRSE